MRVKLAWVLGILCAANGVFMLLAPAPWYAITRGVTATGPFNQHFVRDIGAAYLVAGGGLVWFATDARARAVALASAAFLALHALVHLADAIAGREALDHVALDLPTIYLSALIALWIAWPQSTTAKEENTDDQMAVAAAHRRLRKEV
jgi:uncharacterized protein YjeT (DUF2065 family)